MIEDNNNHHVGHVGHPEVLKSEDHEALHRYSLIKETSLIFALLRLKHLAKEKNLQEKKFKIRKKLSRLVIISHP